MASKKRAAGETEQSSRKRLVALLERVQAVPGSRGVGDAIMSRLLGVEHTLLLLLGKTNFVEDWLLQADKDVSKYHNLDCKCASCERVREAKA